MKALLSKMFLVVCLVAMLLMTVHAEENVLTIATNSPNYYQIMEAFEAETGVNIVWDRTVDIMDIISTAYVIKNPDIDLYIFNSADGLYTLKNKNYYEPLDSSEILSAAYETLYPAFQNLCTDEGKLAVWVLSASPMSMWESTSQLQAWGLQSPTTWDELMDVCNEILEEDLLEEGQRLMMSGYTQSSMLNLFMRYYIMTSIQEGKRIDFTDATFVHYVERIKNELPTEEKTGEFFDIIFNIPSASDMPRTEILPVPSIFQDQSNAVETNVVIGVVNPYAKNKEAAIKFLEYCAGLRSAESYFIYQTLTEPMESEAKLQKMEQIKESIARLEANEERTLAQDDYLKELYEDLEDLNENHYLFDEDDIAHYQEMAQHLYISEGSPLTYDSALQTLAKRYLNGAFDAEGFAKECQTHIEMIYAEIGE